MSHLGSRVEIIDASSNDLLCASHTRLGRSEDWIVIGWFTPNYYRWALRLKSSLEALNAPYHLMARKPVGYGWEAETMQKATVVRTFMGLYPDRTLVLLDADCVVRRCPSELALSVRGDVAAYVRSRRDGRAKDRARIKIMSGTMVFRPTEPARRFVENWVAAGSVCDRDDVDQTSLMLAIAQTTQFTFEPISAEWCDFEKTHPNPAVLHDNASAEVRKAGWFKGAVARVRKQFSRTGDLVAAQVIRRRNPSPSLD